MEKKLFLKKFLCLSAAIVVIILIFLGCKQAQIIRIGVVGTMSGNQSDLSVSGRRGIELATAQINDTGGILGKTIELVVKDDLNNPTRAKEIVTEYVADGIELVIGHFTSDMLLAAYEDIEANNILYLGPTISADSLSNKDDHFIRFIASTKEQAKVLANTAIANSNKKFFVVTDEKNKGFHEPLRVHFENSLFALGGEVEGSLSYRELNNEVYRNINDAILNYPELDGIFLITSALDFALIAQNFAKNKIDISLYGPLWAHTNDVIRVGGNAVEKNYLVSGINRSNKNEAFVEFNEKYKAFYGEEVSFAALYSYETMMALAKAIEMGQSTKWQEVKEALIRIEQYEGLQSNYSIDAFGDSTRNYSMDQIIKGEFIGIK